MDDILSLRTNPATARELLTLTDEDLTWLATVSPPKTFSAGLVLISEQERQPNKCLIIIVKGGMRVTREGEVVLKASVGSILGEMSFLSGTAPFTTVAVATESEIIEIPADVVRQKMGEDAGFRDRFNRVLGAFAAVHRSSGMEVAAMRAAPQMQW